ncbi:MAG TPA: hypothetical protein VGM44_00530 [Polyangiaceae bacterium]
MTEHPIRSAARHLLEFCALGCLFIASACGTSSTAHETEDAGMEAGCTTNTSACGSRCCRADQLCMDGVCAVPEGCIPGVCGPGCPCAGCCAQNQICEQGQCIDQAPDSGCAVADCGTAPEPDAGNCDGPDLTVRISADTTCADQQVGFSGLLCNRGNADAPLATATFFFGEAATAACTSEPALVPASMCIPVSCEAPEVAATTLRAEATWLDTDAGQSECNRDNNSTSASAPACP